MNESLPIREMLCQSSKMIYHAKHRAWWPTHECLICRSKAIGINFGVPTCAPCKAFFRRNARRKEILQTSCPFQAILSSNWNKTDRSERDDYCSQIRYCSSCRLRRCFDMGMKEELVRTDEENQRHRELIEINRQHRKQLLEQDQPENQSAMFQQVICKTGLLQETDWNHISNIVFAYDTYCLKNYIQRRANIFHTHSQLSDDGYVKINYHASTTIDKITSFLLFLSTIPTVKSLPKSDRLFLCKHNIRPLILLNSHELDQLCYSEPWQLNYDNRSVEYICGSGLFYDLVQTKLRAEQILITDPVVTRLWLLILFFSTPLHCYYDHSLPEISTSRRIAIMQIQHSYTTLLWNYLSHRHGDLEAMRIFSNLVGIYLRMQRISQAINTEIRTRYDLSTIHASFNQAVIIDDDNKW